MVTDTPSDTPPEPEPTEPKPPKKRRSPTREQQAAAVRRRADADMIAKLTPRPPRVARFSDLGPVPTEPLALNAYMHAALGISAQQVMADPTLTDAERREELLRISKAAAPLLPDAVRARVDAAMKGDASHLAKPADGPKMEPATNGEQSSTARAVTPRRGRPRKRGLA